MESISENNIFIIFIIGFLIILIIVGFSLLIVVLSKRKSDKQNLKIKTIESEHQKKIFSSIVETQESERKRIAGSLHDDINASISTIGLLLDRISSITKHEANELSEKTRNITHKVNSEISDIVNDLSPTSLAKFGLGAEILDISETINKSKSMEFELVSNLGDKRFNNNIEINVFRVLKEFINNSIKYSGASKIVLEIRKIEDKLSVEIFDNGVGFEMKNDDSVGHGIKNMESRIYILNGKFNYFSATNKGTKLEFEIPLS